MGTKPSYPIGGVIHWVSVTDCISVDSCLFEPLFKDAEIDIDNFMNSVNPDSRKTLTTCKAEAGLASLAPGEVRQFERQGYFCLDADSSAERIKLNRIVALRDSWVRAAGT
jgi:glutaminyl-tRNA synthetase